MNEMRRLMWQSILVFQHCVAFATAVCVLYTSVRDRSEVRLWQIFVMSLEKHNCGLNSRLFVLVLVTRFSTPARTAATDFRPEA